MPPVTRSDFPYPLRTVDGKVNLDLNGEDISFQTFTPNTNLQLDGANTLIGNPQVGSGSNVLQTNPTLINPYTDEITVTGLDASSSVQTSITKKLITIPNTGSGDNVLSTAPTISSANMVTPSATEITINNLTANNAVQTDGLKKLVSIANTGSGNNVLQTNPSLVNPVLGTASATSVNISSLAANSAVQTNGSSTLVTITNEGSGNNILQTSPTLITPNIGVATGTSLDTTGNVESDQILVSNRTTGFGLVVNSTTESTSTTTGSARFIGGVGVGGNVYVGGDVNTTASVDSGELWVRSTNTASSQYTGAIKCFGGIGCTDTYVSNTAPSSSKTTGAVKCLGGIGCEDIYVDSTQQAASKTNAAIKCQGGIGCKDIYVDSTTAATSQSIAAIKCQGGVACEDVYVDSTTTATSKTSAAVKCQGGVGCEDVYVNNTTSATSKTNAAVKCQGGVGCEDLYVNTTARIPTITSLSTLNTLPFAYERGTFTPVCTTLVVDPAFTSWTVTPWDTPTINYSLGYYSRIGDQVSICLTTSVDFGGFQNDQIYSIRIPIIQGLPFRAAIPGNVMAAQNPVFNQTATNVSFPNGRTIGGVPAVSVPVYDEPYEAMLCPNGYGYQPIRDPLVLPYPTYTMDGKTIIFEATTSLYVPDVGVPPYSEVYVTNTTIQNIHVLATGSYTVTFYISMNYITDE